MKKYFTILLLTVISVLGSNALAQNEDVQGWSHFAWGAEVGGAIDLTSNNLSTVNLDAYFGYRNSWIDILGVGAEVDMMLSNSCRSFPVYAMLRTDFSRRKQLLFMDLRGGVVFNNLPNGKEHSRLYLSPGVGINLAGNKTFQSYITLSYVYNGMKPFYDGDDYCGVNGLSMACLRLGIRF